MRSATRGLRAAVIAGVTGALLAATAATARADQESDRLRPDDPAFAPTGGPGTSSGQPANPWASPATGGPAGSGLSPTWRPVGDRAVDATVDGPMPALNRDDLFLNGRTFKRVSNPSTGQGPTENPVYLADDPSSEKPNIHGFIDLPFKTAYVTPRGLFVENSGVVFQPVGGFVFPLGEVGEVKNITFVTGIWNSIDSYQNDTNVGPWNEMDYFASLSASVGPVSLTLTYGLWNFPNSTVNKPSAEHNLDLKINYDDSKLWGDSGFALKPYVDVWWAIAGSSTVVLGREGDTGYVEVGVIPSYTIKASPAYPISLYFPTYISVGPEHYWGAANPDGNVGVFSTSANATVPLAFIPGRYGSWSATVGVSYFYLINDNLLAAGNILSGNDNRNVLVGTLGVGVKF